ncbi:MAG: hypothetical protein WD802_02850 [Gemmatimonadaceae bacterium]
MDPKQDRKEIGANAKGSEVSKKVYAEPMLTVHGKVEDITKNCCPAGSGDGIYGSTP